MVLARAESAPSAPAAAPLRDAAAVLSLTGEQASQGRRIVLNGVVTAAEPDWSGQFFVQDATGGVFVENYGAPAPEPGDVVTIEGVSHPGAFAPIVSRPTWRKTGRAALPEPRRVRIEDLNTGGEDGERVEVTGVVRTARLEHQRLLVDLAVVGHRLQVSTRPPPETDPATLVGARVRVRGTVATHYIGALRHLTSVAVYAPRLEDFTVLEAEPADPFLSPATPVNSVAQYRRGRLAEQRVHVRGVVTLQRPREDVFLQDPSGGLRIVTAQPGRWPVGTTIEAAGFLEYEGHLPLLRDAVIRAEPGAPAPLVPRRVQPAAIAQGEHHGELVTLRGRVLDRSTRPNIRADGSPAGFVTTWMLQGPAGSCTVEHISPERDASLARIPIGSDAEVDGICVLTVDPNGKLTSLRLLLPSLSGWRVLQRPSWLTPARLLLGLAVLTALLVFVLAWLLTVAKKNAALHRLVHELEQARGKLQEAHDTLEQKVAERTAQLQVEMTARKTAEVQFRAVLAERTRLARDLHDTLEQTLAGIALRLNTAAKLARRDPDGSESHLQFARNWLHQSQVDLRRSIWDLRSRELEQFDLPGALRLSAEQLVQGTAITLDVHIEGTPVRLPEVMEENVLRIAQEALTNIAKHAQATRVTLRLSFAPPVLRLRVEDNGVGFDPQQPARDGHFGLVGIGERAKRLDGRVSIQSRPGHGTQITVELPLSACPGAATASAAGASPSP